MHFTEKGFPIRNLSGQRSGSSSHKLTTIISERVRSLRWHSRAVSISRGRCDWTQASAREWRVTLQRRQWVCPQWERSGKQITVKGTKRKKAERTILGGDPRGSTSSPSPPLTQERPGNESQNKHQQWADTVVIGRDGKTSLSGLTAEKFQVRPVKCC